jgi:cytochrome c biogenesis protein CcdA/thiol-disulfide isomerase/thioredoxin
VLLLYVIGFLAGVVAGISPCILPVLPVVLVAGATVPTPEDSAPDARPGTPEDSGPGAEPARGAERALTAPSASTARPAVRTPARIVRAPAAARPSPDRGTRPRPGAAPGDRGGAAGAARTRSYRAYTVVGGLVLSFSVFTLVGSSLLSALGLPQDFLRDAGLVVLGLVAAGLVVPPLGELLERPFVRLGRRQPTGNTGGFVLGLGLGVLFVPCAGPVLTAISVVSATHHVGVRAVVLTVDFALGASVPLLAFALAGQRVAERVAAFRSHAATARRISGVVLLAMTLLIAFNVTAGLQRDVPGYTSALQRHIEGGGYATRQLATLTKRGTGPSSLGSCAAGVSSLEDCGAAPNFQGVTAWLNTPGGRGLSLAGLRGKVVLVDFWTYSCINCQRSLPHVEAWYARYHADGLDVVGVHTPEFAFEHVVSNVQSASAQLGVHYPVAVDDGYKTWSAYNNEYWPAEYLIDATGHVRHAEFGEGDYPVTESLIRQLLVQADPAVHLPRPTDVADTTPSQQLTPESYLGYDHDLPNFDGGSITPDRAAHYQFPGTLPEDFLALSGTWTVGGEAATAGADARLELAFQADDVYLVLGGNGTVGVTVGGKPTETVAVSGIPRLYTLVHSAHFESATLVLTVSPGVQAYDFTFG